MNDSAADMNILISLCTGVAVYVEFCKTKCSWRNCLCLGKVLIKGVNLFFRERFGKGLYNVCSTL